MAENTAAPDSDIQLKKRARRRLVGAVALALLAAIVLPMVMDHEPRPPVQDIQVRIPSQDAGSFTSRLIPGTPAATPLPPAKPAVAEELRPGELKKPELKPLEVPAETKAEVQSKPEPKPEQAAKPVEKPAEKPAEKPTVVKPEAKPEVKQEAKTAAEAQRAEKILNGADAHKADGQWVLQLGAYQEMGNVKVLQAKIKELGYPSYTEKVTTPQGDRIRVRAGPFSSKAAAEKAQAGLKRIGAGGPPGGVVVPK
ncbi:MAG: SPOR domain-containing protein [Rhodocyclaceae bacterium]|nr:SPOR domain-containing protein [Rhodocyclaceae bacterium]